MTATMTEQEKAEVLSAPPQSIMQVLAWCDDLELNPTQDEFDAARETLKTTSLRDTLIALGADENSL